MTKQEFKQIEASAKYIKKMYADINGTPRKPFDGWAGFKHRLIALGVINNADENVPQNWIDAYKKACGR